jgi:Flp pilus assembly protein TadD
VRLNPRDPNAHYHLAKLLQRRKDYAAALAELDAALQLAPDSQSVHYVRGQVLQRLGRTGQARAEMAVASRISNEALDKSQKQLEDMPMPDPELLQEPQ